MFSPHAVIEEDDKNQLLTYHSQVQPIMEWILDPVRLTTLTIVTIH